MTKYDIKVVGQIVNSYYINAESKDEAAFNTLASIIGLTGDRSQTFDYDEKIKMASFKWGWFTCI